MATPSRTMAVPFAIDPSGSIAFTVDPTQQLLDRVTAIIATDLGERLMSPEFGIPLRSSLFQAFTDEMPVLLRTEIQAALNTYEIGLAVDVVQPIVDKPNGLIGISVLFSNTMAGQVGPLQITIPVGG